MKPAIAANPLTGLDRRTVTLTLGCMAAYAAILVASSLQIRYVDPSTTRLFDLPRGLNTLAPAVFYATIALVAYFNVGLLERRPLPLAAVGVELLACALLALAPDRLGAAAHVVGLLAHLGVVAWATLMFATSLTRLPTLKAASVAVVGGIVLRQLCLPLYSVQAARPVGIAGMGALCCLAIACLARIEAASRLAAPHKESLGTLELTNPFSTLLPKRQLYICAFLVSLTYSFSNVFGVPGLSARRLLVVAALLVLLYYLLILKDRQEDNLFSLSVFCIMTGLVLSPFTIGKDEFFSHTFLFLGSTTFSILTWLLVWSLGNRSFVAALPVFGILNCLTMLGNFAGGSVGRIAFDLAQNTRYGAEPVISAVALLFFAFMWFGFKQFSFTDAIRGVEVVDIVEPPAEPAKPAALEADAEKPGSAVAADRIEARCRELLREVDLTPREAEVFELLARGRNARYIMDTLCVTRNTAKTHIRHIYTKMGVHSHQELLSLIEGGGAA